MRTLLSNSLFILIVTCFKQMSSGLYKKIFQDYFHKSNTSLSLKNPISKSTIKIVVKIIRN
ncbi:hypothetical protein LLCC_2416 [Lactococcus cremoris]|uniref:Uncharacterized protein n=1 Tax=Lactococcus lactis subsp. cremoris TaxID=1359 RepID=A0AAD1JXY3_LACLC|nr:hypothetical protein LLCC_2416 [Lactococcus cremoris]BCO02908.1 hypothetical protein LLG32_10020 [Lactococcus cremoris]BCO05760.1 hypothetical protein LLC_10000 [Lactococcus cremoris]